MKKIIVDQITFNKAIASKKLQVAEFLLEHDCPSNSMSYLQCLEIPVFEWLEHRVPILEDTFAENLLEKTMDMEVLKWFFIHKKIIITPRAIDVCILQKEQKTLQELPKLQEGCLTPQNFITACKVGDLEILQVLKDHDCPFDQTVENFVLTCGNKQVLKWFLKNDYF